MTRCGTCRAVVPSLCIAVARIVPVMLHTGILCHMSFHKSGDARSVLCRLSTCWMCVGPHAREPPTRPCQALYTRGQTPNTHQDTSQAQSTRCLVCEACRVPRDVRESVLSIDRPPARPSRGKKHGFVVVISRTEHARDCAAHKGAHRRDVPGGGAAKCRRVPVTRPLSSGACRRAKASFAGTGT